MAQRKRNIGGKAQSIRHGQQLLFLFQPLTYLGRLPPGNAAFGPLPVAHCFLQEAQVFHGGSLIAINQVYLRQALDGSRSRMAGRENHSQDGGMFRHRHVSQGKPNFIGCINRKIGRCRCYGQEQSLRSRLIIIRQFIGKLHLPGMQQIVVVGGKRSMQVLLCQQLLYLLHTAEVHFRIQG